jgi:hypothetical protein
VEKGFSRKKTSLLYLKKTYRLHGTEQMIC